MTSKTATIVRLFRLLAMCEKIFIWSTPNESQGLPKRDAQHLAQAISNKVDVLLTRDEPHFINKRETLEKQFKIKIRRPSELLLEIEPAA